MANEAVLLYQFMPSVDFTCANAAGIERGTLLKLSDPATVAAATANDDIFIGIAGDEKIANDGRTRIPVILCGIAKMVVSAGLAATVGRDVVIQGTNTVADYTTLDDEKGYVVGKALETGAAGESILVLFGWR